jgi:hypothetical protein
LLPFWRLLPFYQIENVALLAVTPFNKLCFNWLIACLVSNRNEAISYYFEIYLYIKEVTANQSTKLVLKREQPPAKGSNRHGDSVKGSIRRQLQV